MVWEENSRLCLHMQLIAILSRIGVTFADVYLFMPFIRSFGVKSDRYFPSITHLSLGVIPIKSDEMCKNTRKSDR